VQLHRRCPAIRASCECYAVRSCRGASVSESAPMRSRAQPTPSSWPRPMSRRALSARARLQRRDASLAAERWGLCIAPCASHPPPLCASHPPCSWLGRWRRLGHARCRLYVCISAVYGRTVRVGRGAGVLHVVDPLVNSSSKMQLLDEYEGYFPARGGKQHHSLLLRVVVLL
jgi:hypothetical protein